MFDNILALALSGDLQAAINRPSKLPAKPSHDGRVATVYIEGILSRTGEYGGTSTDKATAEIKALAADPGVSCIALFISSPGGKVPGIKECADAIAAAKLVKPVLAYIQDVCASGAYWIASQATKVYSDAMAINGGIGTYIIVTDTSGLANSIGIKTVVVKAGKFKGTGVPGTEITAEQLADVQRVVDSINQHFVVGVAAGRTLSLARVQELADGRVHVGQEAVKLGLIDGVLSFDSFAAQLRAAFSQPQMKGSQMFESEKAKGTASDNFWSLVEDKVTAGLSRPAAIERVVIANGELHQAMLAEANPNAHR